MQNPELLIPIPIQIPRTNENSVPLPNWELGKIGIPIGTCKPTKPTLRPTTAVIWRWEYGTVQAATNAKRTEGRRTYRSLKAADPEVGHKPDRSSLFGVPRHTIKTTQKRHHQCLPVFGSSWRVAQSDLSPTESLWVSSGREQQDNSCYQFLIIEIAQLGRERFR